MRLLLNLRKLKPGFVCFIHLHRRLFPASLNNVSVNIYSVKIYIYIYITLTCEETTISLLGYELALSDVLILNIATVTILPAGSK
jgi:hypothetical protein